MAQSRERRRRRAKQRIAPPGAVAARRDGRRIRLRRIVIAFLVVIGVAGILAVASPSDEPSGRAPVG